MSVQKLLIFNFQKRGFVPSYDKDLFEEHPELLSPEKKEVIEQEIIAKDQQENTSNDFFVCEQVNAWDPITFPLPLDLCLEQNNNDMIQSPCQCDLLQEKTGFITNNLFFQNTSYIFDCGRIDEKWNAPQEVEEKPFPYENCKQFFESESVPKVLAKTEKRTSLKRKKAKVNKQLLALLLKNFEDFMRKESKKKEEKEKQQPKPKNKEEKQLETDFSGAYWKKGNRQSVKTRGKMRTTQIIKKAYKNPATFYGYRGKK